MKNLERQRTIPRRVWRIIQRDPYAARISIAVFWMPIVFAIAFSFNWILWIPTGILMLFGIWLYRQGDLTRREVIYRQYRIKELERDTKDEC